MSDSEQAAALAEIIKLLKDQNDLLEQAIHAIYQIG